MTDYTLHRIPKTGKFLLLDGDGNTLAAQIDRDLVPLIADGVSAQKGTLVDTDGQYLVGTISQLMGVNG